MSKQIHDGESQRRKQVKFRANVEQIERLDALAETSEEFDSRSDALRSAVSLLLDGDDHSAAPRQPPVDDPLRTAYLTLVELANYDGIVPNDIALAELASTLGKNQKVVERRLLPQLRKRGYLCRKVDSLGRDPVWKLRGFEQ